jgi:hypothetical protein
MAPTNIDRHLVGVEDEQQHGDDLQRAGPAPAGSRTGRCGVRAQLAFAAAAVMSQWRMSCRRRRARGQQANTQTGGEQQGDDRGLEDHGMALGRVVHDAAVAHLDTPVDHDRIRRPAGRGW